MNIVNTKLLSIHDISLDDAANEVLHLSSTTRFELVVTPNIDHCARLIQKKNDELLQIYREAALCLCDSRILQKVLRLRRLFVNHVVPGSTLTEHLFKSGLLENKQIMVIGSANEDIAKLKMMFPELDISHINPSMGFIDKAEEIAQIVDEVCHNQPDVVFLAVGSPRQELLAQKIQQYYQRGVGLCVGASILFVIGKEKRAPKIIQTIHLEWLYRAAHRPGTLIRRYLNNFTFLYKIYSRL